MARLLLWGQHRRRGDGLPAGRLLLVEGPRHGHGHLCRGGPQCDRGRDRPGHVGRLGSPRGAGRRREQGGRRPGGRRLGRVSGDRAFRDVGAGRRGDLDPAALALARGHRLHVLVDPGRIPDRTGDRQQPRGIAGAAGRIGACDAGRLPVAPDRCHRLDGVHDLEVAPLLADLPQPFAEPLVHIPARPAAVPLDRPAAGVPVGHELPPGADGGRRPRPGSRAAGRWGLRG